MDITIVLYYESMMNQPIDYLLNNYDVNYIAGLVPIA